MQKAEVNGFETQNEFYVRQYLEALGYQIFKNNTLLPDYTCVGQNGRVIFFEAKHNFWRLSKAQKRIFPKLKASKYKIKLINVRPIPADYDRAFGRRWMSYRYLR